MSLDVSRAKAGGIESGDPHHTQLLDTSGQEEVETLKEKLREYTTSYSKLKTKHQETRDKH